jgi:hypothetical protein
MNRSTVSTSPQDELVEPDVVTGRDVIDGDEVTAVAAGGREPMHLHVVASVAPDRLLRAWPNRSGPTEETTWQRRCEGSWPDPWGLR